MEHVGRYRLVRRIGAGGMAEVFEAVAEGDRGFQRRVAIKRILADHRGDPSFVRMFLDEANLLARLHHTNIVSIVDFGVIDGAPFQVLEFVDGIDAHQLQRGLGGGVFPEGIALSVAIEVAHALTYAHGATNERGAPLGVVHRDVTPSNVLLSFQGDVKLGDFGIAFAHDRQEKTTTGVAKGKAAYMAPEQLFGREVDARVDVFGLGCALHAMVSGKSPLTAEGQVERLLRDGSLVPDASLDSDLADIVVRATRRDRDERYGDVDAMASELGAALARRQSGDARSALRRFMSEHRTRHAPRGKLDGLLDVEWILGADERRESGAQGVRTFTQRAIDAPIDAPTPPRRGPEAPRAPSDRVRPWPIAIGIAALCATAGLGLWLVDADTETATEARAPSTPPLREAPPAPLVAQRSDAATGDAAITSPVIDAATRPPRGTPHVRPARDAEVEVAPPPAAIATATGVLTVGGEGARRAEIVVDGVSMGFAPRRLVLPLGAHVVALHGEGGRVLDERSVTIAADHTRSAPLRIVIDEPSPN